MSFTYNYHRRATYPVKVGPCFIGGNHPILIQSMTNTSTSDIEGSASQIIRIADKGGELVRLTTQGEKEAAALEGIKNRLRELDCKVPLSADVHFNPKAAFKAAEFADKVRINPGNFVDAARTFRKLSFTKEEYDAELQRIREAFIPLIQKCKSNNVALRLGVNHGSLSDRIMSQFGDTPEGMVESVMEYLYVCEETDFRNVVISIKASQTPVMFRTVKLLAKRMDEEWMNYPLHLGVTEAGDAEDGRIKSAVGIGALLAEGIGDTIRVSLSEPPENEIPVAVLLRDYISSREGHEPITTTQVEGKLASRAKSEKIEGFNKNIFSLKNDQLPAGIKIININASSDPGFTKPESAKDIIILESFHKNPVGELASWIDRFQNSGYKNPIILRIDYGKETLSTLRIKAGADFGALLLNGYGSGIDVDSEIVSPQELATLELDILQASGLRVYKTEYIACPSCGRTLFDLPSTLQKVKEATRHLKGLKIGVMGCIVNGPGEMADADYGYVGAGPGRVSIYRGKELIKKNIPTEDALPELLALIKQDNK